MSKIIAIIKALPNLLPLKPVTAIEISEAEKQLGLYFADDYRKYLAEYGAILADGIELTGIAKSVNRNVVSVTKQERELNVSVPQNLYVLENVGIEGIIIWQDERGSVYKTTSNNPPTEITSSLVEYIESKSK